MRITDLNPQMKAGVLILDCPCGGGHKLRVSIGTSDFQWQMEGGLASCTLSPSIRAQCWHGHIINGEVTTVRD